MAKKTGPKPPTKTEILNSMAEATGTTKKEVQVFFDALAEEIKRTSLAKAQQECSPFLVFARLSFKTSLLCQSEKFATQVPVKCNGPSLVLQAKQSRYVLLKV